MRPFPTDWTVRAVPIVHFRFPLVAVLTLPTNPLIRTLYDHGGFQVTVAFVIP